MEIWRNCKETNRTFDTARGFLNHLRFLNITSKDYYDKWEKKENDGKCLVCSKTTKYHGFQYKKYCSFICGVKSDEHKNAVKNKFINNPDALVSFRKKRKNWCSTNIKKTLKTKTENAKMLGLTLDEYWSQSAKKGAKNISASKRKEMTLKGMETKLRNGFKSGRSGYKKYNFFDETVSLQGYEPFVLNYLINEYKLGKTDIVVGKKNIPIISYIDDNKPRHYFPDFYLPKINLIIEVKSVYTFDKHIKNVLLKCNAAKTNGYSIIVIILSQYEVRKNKLDGSKKLLDLAISSKAPSPTWFGMENVQRLAEMRRIKQSEIHSSHI